MARKDSVPPVGKIQLVGWRQRPPLRHRHRPYAPSVQNPSLIFVANAGSGCQLNSDQYVMNV